jgi:hypothetical protein
MPEFDEHLTASIASAKAKLAEREEAKRAEEAAKRERAQALADRFAGVKSRAMRFKHNHLEPLFRKAQGEVNQAGFHFVGNYINDEGPGRGRVGSTLESGESCFIMAAIDYSVEQSTARVEAQTPSGSCFSQSQDFDENTSLAWFQTNVAEAIGKLLETGEVPIANVVRYGGRVV